MLRFALRRFYIALVGLMLLSLPLFAAMRVPMHNEDLCHLKPSLTVFCEGNPPMALERNGPFYAIWQTGMPPNDWWPIAVAVLAAEGTVTLARRWNTIA